MPLMPRETPPAQRRAFAQVLQGYIRLKLARAERIADPQRRAVKQRSLQALLQLSIALDGAQPALPDNFDQMVADHERARPLNREAEPKRSRAGVSINPE